MKRFSFGMEKVLSLREYREEEAKLELGRAVGALAEIEDKIRRTAGNRCRAAQERFSGKNSALDIAVWDNYIIRLDQEAEKLTEEAARAEAIVEEKRELYLEASRERKVIEKLKEKREKEYRREVFAEETKELDDISGVARARRL
ncbi:MAG: flagellar export protein FliJ [Treponema sp.]|jgi:flagellar FliJ protein|nr:flagellar export protein FliJ [Treponema sp.]